MQITFTEILWAIMIRYIFSEKPIISSYKQDIVVQISKNTCGETK